MENDFTLFLPSPFALACAPTTAPPPQYEGTTNSPAGAVSAGPRAVATAVDAFAPSAAVGAVVARASARTAAARDVFVCSARARGARALPTSRLVVGVVAGVAALPAAGVARVAVAAVVAVVVTAPVVVQQGGKSE